MQMTQTQKIILSIIAVVVLLGVYITFDKRSKNSPIIPNTNETGTTTGEAITDLTPGKHGGYTVEQVPPNTTPAKQIQVPPVRPVTFGAGVVLDQQTKDLVTSKINSLQAMIKANPGDLKPWLDLGMYQKMAGDYAGAVISWKYVAEATSKDFIAYGNLGELYAYYIHDNAMSENYYKLAIARDSKQSYLYTQLSDVYRYVFKDMIKAGAIIDQGLRVMPGDLALTEFKNNLK